jgi:hypothetical protein
MFSGEYDIAFAGLATGKHHFRYEIGKEFLSRFELTKDQNGKYAVEVHLEKQSRMMKIF